MSELPTGHLLVLGGTGSGKTVTAKGIVEQLLDEHRHVCIVDPTGVWNGLRTMADGEAPGYPIPIFGGLHADLPIAHHQGEAIGKLIAEGMSAILDVSQMDSTEQQRFVADLVAALRKHKPRSLFHFVVDEADEFAPQTSPSAAGEAAMRQLEWMAKRGRTFGYALLAITQRPADIAKSVISQVETVVAHRLVAPNDQNALKAWLKAHADKETLDRVMASLPGLATGERWFYSPTAGVLEHGVSPMPKTFDSSRAPEPGETLAEPKTLAEIDLGAIRAALAEPEDETSDESGTVSAVSDEVERLRGEIIGLQGTATRHARQSEGWQQRARSLEIRLQAVRDALDAPASAETESLTETVVIPRQAEVPPSAERPVREKAGVTAGETATDISKPQQKVLDAIAWWGAFGIRAPSVEQVAFIAGYSPGSGGFNNLRGKLRSAGLIEYPSGGAVALTDEGGAVAIGPQTPPTRAAFHAAIRAKLSDPQWRMIAPLIAAYPGALAVDDLADAAGYSAGSGGFNNLRGKLRTLGLIDYPSRGQVRLENWMMP